MDGIRRLCELVEFDEVDRKLHDRAYSHADTLASVMSFALIESEDLKLAFHSLHLALMYFGAALCKQDKYKD